MSIVIPAQTPILLPSEVRLFVRDSLDQNLLLDELEFPDASINLAMDLACDFYNSLAPSTANNRYTFPHKSLLLYGTLGNLFLGRAALLARNTMQYSDGGLQIPIEERFALYQSLGGMFQQQFEAMAKNVKVQINLDELGWGSVSSDYSRMPIW